MPAKTEAADQDKEVGWWFGKEEAEAEAAVGALSVDLAVDEVEEVTPDVSRMVPVSGGVRVNVVPDKVAHGFVTGTGAFPQLQCGDVVEVPMRLRAPERYRDPGAWQYADYLLAKGVGAHATVRAGKLVRVSDGAASLQCRLYAAQAWASGRMLGYVWSGENRGLPRVMRLSADECG